MNDLYYPLDDFPSYHFLFRKWKEVFLIIEEIVLTPSRKIFCTLFFDEKLKFLSDILTCESLVDFFIQES